MCTQDGEISFYKSLKCHSDEDKRKIVKGYGSDFSRRWMNDNNKNNKFLNYIA